MARYSIAHAHRTFEGKVQRVHYVNLVNGGPHAIRKTDYTTNEEQARAWMEQLQTMPLAANLRTDTPQPGRWCYCPPMEKRCGWCSRKQ